jgi:hypothetical protein
VDPRIAWRRTSFDQAFLAGSCGLWTSIEVKAQGSQSLDLPRMAHGANLASPKAGSRSGTSPMANKHGLSEVPVIGNLFQEEGCNFSTRNACQCHAANVSNCLEFSCRSSLSEHCGPHNHPV